ncbi:lipocalin family protein [Streptococcus sp. zg-JUN1979]|uniref:lipocalin family protein n=1 Tax=Streptococcus sp. zg-JUN1979 TaxID=3391450 RepID=UPI0039A6C8E8
MRRKLLGLVIALFSLIILSACSGGLTGTYHEIEEKDGHYVGYVKDAYYEFEGDKFTITDGDEKRVGSVNKDNGTLHLGSETGTYKVDGDILTITSDDDTIHFVKKDSDLYNDLKKAVQEKENKQKELLQAFRDASDRVVDDFEKRFLGTYKSSVADVEISRNTFSWKAVGDRKVELEKKGIDTEGAESYTLSVGYYWDEEYESSDYESKIDDTIAAVNKINTWEEFYEFDDDVALFFTFDNEKDMDIFCDFDSKTESLSVDGYHNINADNPIYQILISSGSDDLYREKSN